MFKANNQPNTTSSPTEHPPARRLALPQGHGADVHDVVFFGRYPSVLSAAGADFHGAPCLRSVKIGIHQRNPRSSLSTEGLRTDSNHAFGMAGCRPSVSRNHSGMTILSSPSSAGGNFGSIFSIVSATIWLMTALRYHFLSAGITCHGADDGEQFRSMA